MKRHPWLLPAAFLGAAIAVLLTATRRDLSEPHLRLFSDMVHTPAYHSQSENPVFRDGQTLQPPPPGTIPRDFHPVHYSADEAGRELAGRELKNPFTPSFESMARGKQMYEAFCSHCHGLSGLGDGAVSKLFPQFSFPLATKSTYDLPDGTLFHIMTYGRNLMPPVATQLSQDDRWKIVLYLRDLQRQEIARLGPAAIIPEDPRRHSLVSDAYGKELFAMNCASCHGEEGRSPKPGIPTLHSPAVLAIADDSYYWDIINHGRPGTQMPAWKAILTPTQIKSIVLHIRSWAGPAPDARVAAQSGQAERGRALFASHCIGCHGPQGRGGIGPSLASPSFLAMASDQFLRETIALGRHHTPMPASYDLGPQDVAALVAYIRSWSRRPPTYDAVAALGGTASKAAGRALFTAHCAACHGASGEGAIGSALNSQSFLTMTDNRFLYNVITEGRPGTAMPAWRSLSAQNLADLLAYARGWQKAPSVAVSSQTRHGRPEFGEVLFRQECAKCHGPQGGGDIGTQIGNPILLSQESDDFLWRTIAYGKDGTEMKGFLKRARNPLAPEDIDHLVAYLRKMQKNPPPEGLRRTYSWASAKDGRVVYETKAACIQCHGPDGSGASGPALGNPAFLKIASNGFLYGTIVLGREGSAMHSYHNGDRPHLEEADIENVIAYLRSLESTPSTLTRRVEQGPQLVADGHALFEQNCARCHGRQGLGKHGAKPGDFAPSLNNQEFLKAADDNFLLATIALGRPGTPMRAFGDGMAGTPGLSADQIRRIVAFLRSWEKRK